MSSFAYPGVAFPGDTWPSYVGPRFDAEVAARSLDEVLAGSHRRLVRARLSGGPQDGADLPVTAGPMQWEYDAPVRLSGTLTVAALDEWDDLTAGAALHPESGTEILLAAGVVDDEGVKHWWPYGVVRPVTVAVTTAPDAIEVTCRVLDRGGIVAHARADRPESVASGTGLLAGILAALTRIAPWLPVDLPLDEDVQATTDVVLAERAGDDVWEGCRDVARSLGRLLYVDETGTVVAPLVTLPQATDPITVPLTAWQAEIDHERLVHQVAARWEEARPEDAAPDWVPEAGTVTVRDPASLTLPSTVPVVTRKYGGDESVLTSDTHARAAATAQLADFLDLAVSGGCSAVPHPDLKPGAILDDDSGRRFRVTRLDIDLAGGPVQVSLGNASRGLARRLATLLGYTGGRERTEIVTSVAPLMSRAIGDEDGVPLLVEPSDATAGVVVGDPIRVMHDGSGRRVATAVLVKKDLSAKYAGESLGTVGGASLSVGGDATLRVRATNSAGTSSYSTFSGGDVTVSVPDPPAPNLSAYAQKNDTWTMSGYGWTPTFSSPPASYSSAWASGLQAALADLRTAINATRSVYWTYD